MDKETCNLDRQEFMRRVAHNVATVLEAYLDGVPLYTVLDKIYAYDAEPGEMHMIELCRKIDDIFPALVLGHLPIFATSGADGWRANDDGTFTHVEYKLCLFNPDSMSVGPMGGLRMEHGGASKPTGITSAISASYTLCTDEIIYTKARDTYFVLVDRTDSEYEIIDALMLSSEKIVPFLLQMNGKQRAISLARFINDGERAQHYHPFKMKTWQIYKHEFRMNACIVE